MCLISDGSLSPAQELIVGFIMLLIGCCLEQCIMLCCKHIYGTPLPAAETSKQRYPTYKTGQCSGPNDGSIEDGSLERSEMVRLDSLVQDASGRISAVPSLPGRPPPPPGPPPAIRRLSQAAGVSTLAFEPCRRNRRPSVPR